MDSENRGISRGGVSEVQEPVLESSPTTRQTGPGTEDKTLTEPLAGFAHDALPFRTWLAEREILYGPHV